MTKKVESMLDCFERKILRRIYGPVKDRVIWRIRYNGELYKLYDDTALSTLTRLKRLKWAGYVVRMEEGRIPRKVLEGHFDRKTSDTMGRDGNS